MKLKERNLGCKPTEQGLGVMVKPSLESNENAVTVHFVIVSGMVEMTLATPFELKKKI